MPYTTIKDFLGVRDDEALIVYFINLTKKAQNELNLIGKTYGSDEIAASVKKQFPSLSEFSLDELNQFSYDLINKLPDLPKSLAFGQEGMDYTKATSALLYQVWDTIEPIAKQKVDILQEQCKHLNNEKVAQKMQEILGEENRSASEKWNKVTKLLPRYVEILTGPKSQPTPDTLNRIAQQAMGIALANPKALLFDPQGRVLIDVVDGGKTTTVSLDITKDKTVLKEEYEKQYPLTKSLNTLDKIRGSVIPLQQEFHFHLALAARSLTNINPKNFPEDKMTVAHQNTMEAIHPLITVAYSEALKNATNQHGTIDDVKFIKNLDKARKKIFDEVHDVLAKEVFRVTGNTLSPEEVKLLKHSAETTTATPNDVLYTDHSMGLATWIAGSEVTAHDRGEGADHLADRQLLTMRLGDDDTINAILGRQRLQIRTPSLDMKEGENDETITDVSNKLNALNMSYNMSSEEVTHPNPVTGTQAFTYNLYTAINDPIDDLQGKNKQSEGAQVILRGAHEYNKAQLADNKKPPVLCFVQNISVNGFGDPLGYSSNFLGYSSTALRNEATLMTEMAMVHNLVGETENDSESFKGLSKGVSENYKTYLKNDDPKKPSYFSQSTQGKQAIEDIAELKHLWKNENIDSSKLTPVDKAKAALKKMLANNLHQDHRFAKLIQSLSVFIEDASIGGCKSGNERAQAINGRVGMLDSLAAGKPDDKFWEAMNAVAQAKTEVCLAAALNLDANLNNHYDEHLQAASSVVSNADQGAGAKVCAKNESESNMNRNYAESPMLKYLRQKFAGKMQAHKEMTPKIAEAHGYPSMSFGKYMKKQYSGTKGAAALFIGLVTTAGVAPLIYSAVSYNAYKQKVTDDANKNFTEKESWQPSQSQFKEDKSAKEFYQDYYRGANNTYINGKALSSLISKDKIKRANAGDSKDFEASLDKIIKKELLPATANEAEKDTAYQQFKDKFNQVGPGYFAGNSLANSIADRNKKHPDEPIVFEQGKGLNNSRYYSRDINQQIIAVSSSEINNYSIMDDTGDFKSFGTKKGAPPFVKGTVTSTIAFVDKDFKIVDQKASIEYRSNNHFNQVFNPISDGVNESSSAQVHVAEEDITNRDTIPFLKPEARNLSYQTPAMSSPESTNTTKKDIDKTLQKIESKERTAVLENNRSTHDDNRAAGDRNYHSTP